MASLAISLSPSGICGSFIVSASTGMRVDGALRPEAGHRQMPPLTACRVASYAGVRRASAAGTPHTGGRSMRACGSTCGREIGHIRSGQSVVLTNRQLSRLMLPAPIALECLLSYRQDGAPGVLRQFARRGPRRCGGRRGGRPQSRPGRRAAPGPLPPGP